MKRVKRLKGKDLQNIIENTITSIISEKEEGLSINQPAIQSNQTLLVEMARINMMEQKGYFPYNKWEIKIWSNDHNPPHFHIIKDGWNVSFVIETGEIYEIVSEGNKKGIYNYMVKNVQQWLHSPCAILPLITNQQNAMAQWLQIHDGK